MTDLDRLHARLRAAGSPPSFAHVFDPKLQERLGPLAVALDGRTKHPWDDVIEDAKPIRSDMGR